LKSVCNRPQHVIKNGKKNKQHQYNTRVKKSIRPPLTRAASAMFLDVLVTTGARFPGFMGVCDKKKNMSFSWLENNVDDRALPSPKIKRN